MSVMNHADLQPVMLTVYPNMGTVCFDGQDDRGSGRRTGKWSLSPDRQSAGAQQHGRSKAAGRSDQQSQRRKSVRKKKVDGEHGQDVQRCEFIYVLQEEVTEDELYKQKA